MVRPEGVNPEDMEGTQIIPISGGEVDGHQFVVSIDHTGSIIVQFEEGAAGFNIGRMLSEAHNLVYGYVPDEDPLGGMDE